MVRSLLDRDSIIEVSLMSAISPLNRTSSPPIAAAAPQIRRPTF
jgi:hypothetical protein